MIKGSALHRCIVMWVFPVAFCVLLFTCNDQSNTSEDGLHAPSQSAFEEPVAVVADGVEIHSGPSPDYPVVGTRNKGDTLYETNRTEETDSINDRTGPWVRVTDLCGNAQGWVFAPLLTTPDRSARAIYRRARELETSDPDQALELYREVEREYPLARLDMGCHGSVPYAKEVEHRIRVVDCLEEKRPGYELEEISRQLEDAIDREDRGALASLADCDFRLEHGPIKLHFTPAEGVDRALEFLTPPPDFTTANRSGATLTVQTHATQNSYHYFKFEERSTGFFWAHYAPPN